MIQLTRLNNSPLVINSDLIKFIEESPDTVVTLITGEKLVVREKVGDVLARITVFRRSVIEGLTLCLDASSAHALIARSALRDNDEPVR